jgi:hypothetical protein
MVLFVATGAVLAQAKTHDVTGEVVKADATAKTLTLKADGKESTSPVEGDAVAQLKDLKAGDRVTVTCRDEGSTHKAITKIVKAKAT